MKEILSKKRKFKNYETITLIEGCSATINPRLPPKLKDPSTFHIPYTIWDHHFGKAHFDLEASINLMPFSIFRKLALGKAQPTSVTLQMPD